MVWTEIIFGSLASIVVIVGTLLALKMTSTSQKYPAKPNMPRVEIWSKTILAFTEGYSEGQVKMDLLRKNGNTYFEFYPDDVEQGGFTPRPEPKNFVCDENLVKRSASGDWSSRREKIIILPKHKLDLPNSMQGDNHLNNWAEVETQKAFLKRIVPSLSAVGDEALLEILSNFSRVGYSKMELDKLKSDVEHFKKTFGQNQPK